MSIKLDWADAFQRPPAFMFVEACAAGALIATSVAAAAASRGVRPNVNSRITPTRTSERPARLTGFSANRTGSTGPVSACVKRTLERSRREHATRHASAARSWVDFIGAQSLACYATSGISEANAAGFFAAVSGTHVPTNDQEVPYFSDDAVSTVLHVAALEAAATTIAELFGSGSDDAADAFALTDALRLEQ